MSEMLPSLTFFLIPPSSAYFLETTWPLVSARTPIYPWQLNPASLKSPKVSSFSSNTDLSDLTVVRHLTTRVKFSFASEINPFVARSHDLKQSRDFRQLQNSWNNGGACRLRKFQCGHLGEDPNFRYESRILDFIWSRLIFSEFARPSLCLGFEQR
ncbi:hypothetical protein B0H13DRAFT_1895351 [Mycena leptocephala]|nr:hypothetical protein B0H13DRAFT_1895351 [Mycena leptocephala]